MTFGDYLGDCGSYLLGIWVLNWPFSQEVSRECGARGKMAAWAGALASGSGAL